MWVSIYNFLYQTNDLYLILVVAGFFIILSIFSLFLIKWFFPLHLRYKDNAVIGCTAALIGLIYGVLAGFATASLIGNFNLCVDSVQREANAIVDLYRDNDWLREPTKTTVQKNIQKYLNEILVAEWPLMNNGSKVTTAGADILNTISQELSRYKIENNSDLVAVAEMLKVISNLFDARSQRILLSYASLSSEIWYVILMGTVLLLIISYLYGVNFYLHIFTTISSALMVSFVIFLLISLDKPFQGGYLVGPDSYNALKPMIGENEKTNGSFAVQNEVAV